MTGELENNHCYFCHGHLEARVTTLPFVVRESIIIVKQVPADVCTQCGEPLLSSAVARQVDSLLKRAYSLNAEISVLNYSDAPLPELA